MKKCLVIGAAMLDLTMRLDVLPESGDDVYASSQEMSVGGCAVNAADILKHYEIPYDLFAPVGTGIYAGIVEEKLKALGHKSMIKSDCQDNGYCLALVENNGERTFITLAGIECNFKKEWFENLDPSEYDCAYVSGYEIEGEGGENIIDFFEQNSQLEVYYAPGPRITFIPEEKQRRMEALHPILHLNDKEALEYTGEKTCEAAAAELRKLFGNTVMITMGEKGVLLEEGESKIIETIPVKAIDTTGAGDSHIGTVIAMRKSGRNFEDALKEANHISSLVVQVSGPTLSKDEFIKGDY